MLLLTMKSSVPEQVALLRSDELLDANSVATNLGINVRSAANLLQRWTNEGLLVRTGPGTYMSSFMDQDQERLVYQSLYRRFGGNMIRIGQTALSRVGWSQPTDVVHVAIPQSPSRPVPKIHNAVIYPVGAKIWSQWLAHSIEMDLDRPKVLHPLAQLLVYLGLNSPDEMLVPELLNWEAIRKEPAVVPAICQFDKELKGLEDAVDPMHYYSSIYHLRYGEATTPYTADLPGFDAS
jgi:hypothetical protein